MLFRGKHVQNQRRVRQEGHEADVLGLSFLIAHGDAKQSLIFHSIACPQTTESTKKHEMHKKQTQSCLEAFQV
jgi:hypothetical protein